MRPDLPEGTVTFVFTDIEGSTRLLDELGADAYAVALAEHGRVIREACLAEGGVEVNTWGDAFFVAFPTASGALAASAAFTERLVDGPIQVRVGVHTGTALHGEGGYIGHDVHRAARIAAAGHGGQVLVSSSTAALADVELKDLGEHRFKDLGAPERVYQLGDRAFPSLKALSKTNVPVPATPFLGREQELAELVGLITHQGARLVTITGPGGTGKTRLSLQAAAEVSDDFPDGLFWVALAPLRDPALLWATLAQALDVSVQPGVLPVDSVAAAFAEKRALVVVDNCEHVVDGVAGMARTLAERCPRVVLVASSRERLGLRSESVYVVPPMRPEDCELLFSQRASAVCLGFEADEHVGPICAQLDGLPLAIELAAARTRALSTQAIRERLGERLSLLKSRNRDLDDRQRTIEGAIAWSYDLLEPDEQRALRALSVFVGGCTPGAAEEVAGADLDLSESLLDKSLVRHRIDETGQDRYWMLETIREFLAVRLTEAGESEAVADAHRAFFVATADRFGPAAGREATTEHLARFRVDRANLEQALERSIEQGDGRGAVHILRFVARHWFDLGELKDSLPRALAALALDDGLPDDRAHALVDVSLLALGLGQPDDAREMLVEAEARYEDLADRIGVAFTCARRSFVESTLDNPHDAVTYAERAAELAEQGGDQHLASGARAMLGFALMVTAIETDPPDRDALERALALQVGVVDERVREQASSRRTAFDLNNVGVTQFLLGRYREALATLQDGLRLAQEAGVAATSFVLNFGLVAGALGQHRTGVLLTGRILREYRDQDLALSELDRRLIARLEADARSSLGDAVYDDALRTGEAMSFDEVVALALELSADA